MISLSSTMSEGHKDYPAENSTACAMLHDNQREKNNVNQARDGAQTRARWHQDDDAGNTDMSTEGILIY